jgi:hypothetical protein
LTRPKGTPLFPDDAPVEVERDDLHARATDPETSHESMKRVSAEQLQSASEFILHLLRVHGPLADFEIKPLFDAVYSDQRYTSLARQARNQNIHQGRVRRCDKDDPEQTRVNPATDRQQIVWKISFGPAPTLERCEACGRILRKGK